MLSVAFQCHQSTIRESQQQDQNSGYLEKGRLAHVVVIGGGAVGTAVAVQLVREHMRATPEYKLNLTVLDPEPVGPGVPYKPYSKDNTLAQAYKLNQPNDRMSFDPEDVLEFCRFIHPTAPELVRNDFSTRVTYGEFLKKTFRDTQAQLAQSQTGDLVHLPLKAVRVTETKEFSEIQCQHQNGGATISVLADLVVIATGHDKSEFLHELRGQPGFFDCPFHLDELKHALAGQTGDVLVVGTSQSQVDGIGALQTIGFQGTIHSISRRNILPWEFDPEKHPIDQAIEVNLESLTLNKINATDQNLPGDPGSFERLSYLFDREIQNAEAQHIGCGFVFATVLKQFKPLDTPGMAQFLRLVSAKFGNPTPPERFRMLQQLQASGRLKIHAGEVSAQNLKPDQGTFILEHVPSLKGVQFKAVLNGAAFSRTPVKPSGQPISPLLADLCSTGRLKLQGPYGMRQGRHTDRLYLAEGPGTNLAKWGMETFRDRNTEMVHEVSSQLRKLSAKAL